jgi:hypothetical protein
MRIRTALVTAALILPWLVVAWQSSPPFNGALPSGEDPWPECAAVREWCEQEGRKNSAEISVLEWERFHDAGSPATKIKCHLRIVYHRPPNFLGIPMGDRKQGEALWLTLLTVQDGKVIGELTNAAGWQ